jgi:hypothetical protein
MNPDCLSKKLITYSKKALQRIADEHHVQVEQPAPIPSLLFGSSSSSAATSNAKPKAGSLHAYLQRLPPSAGAKRKIVGHVFSSALVQSLTPFC